MYEIHFTDNTRIKDLLQKCDVRLNIVMHHKNGRKVEKVLWNGINVTSNALRGLPITAA